MTPDKIDIISNEENVGGVVTDPINIEEIRRIKTMYVALCILPWFLLSLIKRYVEAYPLLWIGAIACFISIFIMNWKFSQSLGYKKWQSALGL